MKNIIVLIALSLSLFACKNAAELPPEETPVMQVGQKALLSMDFSSFGSSDPIEIQNATINGNNLEIFVRYNGGCKAHTFELVGHKMTTKSIPPQRSIKLFHNVNEDDCRELIEEKLVFDVTPFALGKGEVSLKLEGYDKIIPYIPAQ